MNAINYYQQKGINFDISEGSMAFFTKLNAIPSILSLVPGLAGVSSALNNVISIRRSVADLKQNADEKIDFITNEINRVQSLLNKGQDAVAAAQSKTNKAKYNTISTGLLSDLSGVGPSKVFSPTVTTTELEAEEAADAASETCAKTVAKLTEQLENAKTNLTTAKGYLSGVDSYISQIDNKLTDYCNTILYKLRNCVIETGKSGPGSITASIPTRANTMATEQLSKISSSITQLQNSSIKSVNKILSIAANPFK